MTKRYSVSLMALAITVASMTSVWAQSSTTEATQEQAQPATEEGAKQDAPAPAAESVSQEPEPVREEAPATATEPAKSEAATAPEPVKDDETQPVKQKKAKEEKPEVEQPATKEAAPATDTDPPKQDAQAPAAEPAKDDAAAAPESVKDDETQPVKKKKAKEEKPEVEQPASQQAAPAPETAPAQQETSPTPQATDPARNNTAQPQADEPAQQQVQPVEDTSPVFTAEAVLGDDRPSAGLTDAELRQRIQAAGELAGSDATRAKQKARLQAKAEADTAELNARTAAATGVTVQAGAADAEAAKIAGDNRPAAELDDDALRERIKQTRGILAAEGLSDASTEPLRASLATDTAEIRQRVAARQDPNKDAAANPDESGKANDLPEAKPGKMTVADLMGDKRPANGLTTDALERRIDANRRAMTIKDLPAREQTQIGARLEEDRNELSNRLVDRRNRRKKSLSTGQAIAIGAGVGLVAGVLIASRPTITAAEAYDEELEEWLISPPLVKVRPRYRIEDFAEQPRLRYSVPGIEVDTIRFGFGEGFLRTEEVPKLDRIGGIIERIIAGNPAEVFLIEGHTDAVGSSETNMVLSTERADAVRQALLEYFEIGEENLSTIGRGEAFLKIPTEEPEAENRRVTLRRITPLLKGIAAQ